VALAEMAVASGVGFQAAIGRSAGELFGEAPSRLLVSASAEAAAALRAGAEAAGLQARTVGTAGGDRLVLEGAVDLPLTRAVEAWQGAIPSALALVTDA
jgi:phosphoribosylformylglycinamidine synthase